ncbi:MAG: hypothetical protein D6683_04120 [Actinomyces sp.]|nr:MAG: hypothetical protein D6683_04120 [Actinomyces sp.]
MQCPACGSAVTSEARYCSACGHELVHRVDERRLVTVLFADIVGFTGLSEGRDPESVKNLVDRCFARLADEITAFGGRVDKVVGDAIIALFGAPTAHDDDAERAVRAALALQRAVGELAATSGVDLRLRIGVNTGEVLVGALVGDDYTAMGDVVNTASRLQTTAEPGTVLVGPATHAATVDVIDYRPLGEMEVRGRSAPVAVWQAIAPVGLPGERRRPRAAPLVGRHSELTLVEGAIADAYRRRRAHLVTLLGESGVGKSRLAGEVVAAARQRHGARVLHGRCLPYGEANVWWPVASALRTDIGVPDDASDELVARTVTAAVAEVLGAEPDDAEVRRTTAGLLHLFGADARLVSHGAERAAEEAMRAVRAYVHALAAHSPVLIWITDLHWADDAVLRLLDETLDRLGRQRVAVLATARPDLAERWSPRPVRFDAVTLTVDALDRDAVAELARHVLGEDADPVLVERIVERSGGNPLFVEELARVVAAGGGPDGDEVPATVRSAIAARLDLLDPDALTIVGYAAVLGVEGPVGALEVMAAQLAPGIDVGATLARLERAALIETAGRHWWFPSSLIRDVAYGRLTKTERALLHVGIADHLEQRGIAAAEAVAHHLRRAADLARQLDGVDGLGPDLDDRAIAWTLEAARAVSGASAHTRALELYGLALDLLDPADRRRAALLVDRAEVALRALDLGRVRRDLAEAQALLAATPDTALEVRAALVESELSQWTGDFDTALARAEEALASAAELDDPVLAGDTVRRCGMVQLFLGRHDDAEHSILSALAAYDSVGHRVGIAWARQSLAWISFVRGHLEEAETRLAEALAAFEALDDPVGMAWSRGLLAYVRISQGRFAEGEELAGLTLVDARDRGDRWAQGMMLVALGVAALWTGRVDEAVRRGEQARAILQPGTDTLGTAQAAVLYGRALVHAGRVQEGLRALRDALRAMPTGGPPTALVHLGATVSAIMAGDVGEARRHLGGLALEGAGFDPRQTGSSERLVAAALVALQSGDLPEARRRLATIDDTDAPWGRVAVALTEVAAGADPRSVLETVDDDPAATPIDRVMAHLAAAAAAARHGDTDDLVAHVEAAAAAVPAGDRLLPLLVAVADEVLSGFVGAAARADEAATRVRRLAHRTGAEPAGWVTLWRTVVGARDGDRIDTPPAAADAAVGSGHEALVAGGDLGADGE